MKGIELYDTKSGFKVCKVHYSADPDKDLTTDEGKRWLPKALAGIKGGLSSSSWRKEMEIDFKARSGQKVFEGLELLRDKLVIKPFQVPEWWNIGAGYDWGKNNPFAYIEGVVDGDKNKYIVYGASRSGYEIPAQVQIIKRSPYFNRLQTRYADPSIWTEDQMAKDGSYTSFQKIFNSFGITFVKGHTDDIACVELLEQEWFDIVVAESGEINKVPKENPTLKFFATCEFLFDCLCNLRWSEFSPTIEQERGKKEQVSHAGNDPFDALKYWILNFPKQSTQPKPRSKDKALPMAGELLESRVN